MRSMTLVLELDAAWAEHGSELGINAPISLAAAGRVCPERDARLLPVPRFCRSVQRTAEMALRPGPLHWARLDDPATRLCRRTAGLHWALIRIRRLAAVSRYRDQHSTPRALSHPPRPGGAPPGGARARPGVRFTRPAARPAPRAFHSRSGPCRPGPRLSRRAPARAFGGADAGRA